jgi:hypothetical protein
MWGFFIVINNNYFLLLTSQPLTFKVVVKNVCYTFLTSFFQQNVIVQVRC